MIPSKPFYFLRHGETDWNLEHRAMGQQDIPLNEVGIQQAQDAAATLQAEQFASIICSPLQRAVETARIIAAKHSIPIAIIEELKEASWGIMEGQPKGSGEWLEGWRAGAIIEAGETFTEFKQRVHSGLAKALQFPGPVLIISHGGVYWAIQKFLGLSISDLPNCQPILHKPLNKDGLAWVVENIPTII